MDVPSLPPLLLPDGHDANNNALPFLVQPYVIKGVQGLPSQEQCSHVTMFYEELITLMEGASESWQLITKKYTMILNAMIRICDGEPVKLLRSIYPQIYKWYKKYALVASSDIFVIMTCPYDA
jgi:hypothetical protein